ncbi:MAG: cytochrome c [Fibrobacteria bacterium]|nr:cytochrome c [Fibrobacteria bacterium]
MKITVFLFFLTLAIFIGCTTKPVRKTIPADGANMYVMFCARCHQLDGKGIPGTYPPIYNSDYLMEDRERSIRILIYGQEGEITVNGEKYNGTMKPPEYPDLYDNEIAAILTYVRNNMGNSGDSVSTEEVTEIRKKYAPKIPKH